MSADQIDDTSGVPVYQQLADILRRQIERDQIKGRVPSGKTLAQRYGVSHGSAERALAILVTEGLIYAAVGKGHYVQPS